MAYHRHMSINIGIVLGHSELFTFDSRLKLAGLAFALTH